MDVEYAIKKDVRNNPVVREIDREQKREFVRTAAIGAVIVAMVLFWAAQQFTIVDNGYAVERVRKALTEEEALNRRLRLEMETLEAPQRIEQRAINELHMVVPSVRDTMVIERAPAVVAGRAIVASVR